MIVWGFLASRVNGWVWEGWISSISTRTQVLSAPQLRRPADQQVFRAAGSDSVTRTSVPITQVIPHVCIQLRERMLTYLS